MLKLDPEFGIYALSLKKAVKGMLKADFIRLSDNERLDILSKACKAKCHKGAQNIVEWKDIADKVLEVKSLKYCKVTPHNLKIGYEGYPTVFDDVVGYAVDGVDYLMPFDVIKLRYGKFNNKFVAICRKGDSGELELTGFIY